MENMVVHTTGSRPAGVPYRPSPENERTCRNCGTGEKITGRWNNQHGQWVELACWHVQNDE
jgi:hypothetical protein